MKPPILPPPNFPIFPPVTTDDSLISFVTDPDILPKVLMLSGSHDTLQNYESVLYLVESLNIIRKFVSPLTDISNEPFFSSSFDTPTRKNMKLIAHYSRQFLSLCLTFQRRVVLTWNMNAGRMSKLMTLGVSKFPDHTSKGTGMVKIEIARDAGYSQAVKIIASFD